jgi:hypothetical protein
VVVARHRALVFGRAELPLQSRQLQLHRGLLRRARLRLGELLLAPVQQLREQLQRDVHRSLQVRVHERPQL